MEIKILGSGCVKCNEMERVTRQAVADAGLEATVEHVTEFTEIMAYGVMSTPALVVDDQVRLAGRVPSVADMIKVLQRPGDTGAKSGGCNCSGGCC
ncbi:MAG: thioredoxin family protein [Coriobacteriia bacterium]